jgi:N-acetylmuramic acid 6-phosphate etherase
MSLAETEIYNLQNRHLETSPMEILLDALVDDHAAAIVAVKNAQQEIETALNAAHARLVGGQGRLIYVGAGTSGRLGVLDAAELTPTFGWPQEKTGVLMAGGHKALTEAVEGAEDDVQKALEDLQILKLDKHDVVIGLSASGGAPYVIAAVKAARTCGCATIGVANSRNADLLKEVEYPIYLSTGAEVLQGSTRLKAGTSQKVFLSTFSTALMMKLGYVYEGMMIHLEPTNKKLVARQQRITQTLTGLPLEAAINLLSKAKGDNRIAVLMHKRNLSFEEATKALNKCHGHLRKALEDDVTSQELPTSDRLAKV